MKTFWNIPFPIPGSLEELQPDFLVFFFFYASEEGE